MTQQDEARIKQIIHDESMKSQYGVVPVPFHRHTGIDSPQISYDDLLNLPSGGGATSINGLATGTGVTAVPANTPILMEPSQIFANGVTFNAMGSDYGFTCVTAGQYLITGLVGYTSTQTNSLYRTVIVWTPSGGGATWIVEVDGAGNGGVEICLPATIIYALGVGDLIQLYTEAQYSGGSTVSGAPSKTYLAIAKV